MLAYHDHRKTILTAMLNIHFFAIILKVLHELHLVFKLYFPNTIMCLLVTMK